MFLATHRAAYAAERSTFDGSLPANAPPPWRAMPPYVSTMILRPVRPASPCGPPTTKRPVGFTWIATRRASNISGGSVGTITLPMIALRRSSVEIESACCVDTTTVVTRTGRFCSYSTVTCAFPSGRSHGRSPHFRRSASARVSACASMNRHRHELGRLVARVAEHHPLVAGAAGVHTHRDVGRLAVDGAQHRARLRVEAERRIGVADVGDGRADDVGDRDVRARRDLASHAGEPRRDERLAGYTCSRIFGENGVQTRASEI